MAMNEFAVRIKVDEIVFIPPIKPLSKEQALNLAAWLLVMAGMIADDGHGETQRRFDELYAEAISS